MPSRRKPRSLAYVYFREGAEPVLQRIVLRVAAMAQSWPPVTWKVAA
jgi:hypothetical protein